MLVTMGARVGRGLRLFARALIGLGAVFAATATIAAQAAGDLRVGEGMLWAEPPTGFSSVKPKPATYRSGPMLSRAVPTNQWYSSVVYERWSDVLHAHPLAFRATPDGLEVSLPVRKLVPVDGKQPEIQYPHEPAITLGASAFKPDDARLHEAGDWHVRIRMAEGARFLDATILHGGVYAYAELSEGPVRVRMADDARLIDARELPSGPLVVRIEHRGRQWAVFAPPGSKAGAQSGRDLLIDLPERSRVVSAAALPDTDAATLERFARHAFAFVEATTVNWQFDEASGRLLTRYALRTRAAAGSETTPLVSLYPHQQKFLTQPAPEIGRFDAIRGPMPILASGSFETAMHWRGVLPFWPMLGGEAERDRVKNLLLGDVRRAPSMFGRMGQGTYWTGKTMAAIAHVMAIAAEAGEADSAQTLDTLLRRRFAQWFGGTGPRFVFDRANGTVLGYPEEFGSVAAMNDHHFHYGYWIMAAAQLALRDPSWAAPAAAGGMVGKLIADIATPERGRADFPFLRNFDAYAGHSWAGGDGIYFGHGNNQESSSEAVNAWAALVLWGELSNERALRDLGIYLYLHETAAVLQYWLDVDGSLLDPKFGKPLASMVFGGKYAYSTWWTEEPRQIQGINLLPITPASTYLALPRPYVDRFFTGLERARRDYDARGQSDGTPADIWQDVFAGFLALSDPAAGMRAWNSRGSVELGETRTRTFHWLSTLSAAGKPDRSIGANTTLYTVFVREDGQRTYVVYLPPGQAAREVRFTDGMVVRAEPGKLARATRSASAASTQKAAQ
jgi:endoglucanase Acf2